MGIALTGKCSVSPVSYIRHWKLNVQVVFKILKKYTE